MDRDMKLTAVDHVITVYVNNKKLSFLPALLTIGEGILMKNIILNLIMHKMINPNVIRLLYFGTHLFRGTETLSKPYQLNYCANSA